MVSSVRRRERSWHLEVASDDRSRQRSPETTGERVAVETEADDDEPTPPSCGASPQGSPEPELDAVRDPLHYYPFVDVPDREDALDRRSRPAKAESSSAMNPEKRAPSTSPSTESAMGDS